MFCQKFIICYNNNKNLLNKKLRVRMNSETKLLPNFTLGIGVGFFENNNILNGYKYFKNYILQNGNKKIDSEIIYNILKGKFNEYKEDKKYEKVLLIGEVITQTTDDKFWNNYEFWLTSAESAKETKSNYFALECYKQCLNFKECDKDIYRVIGDILFFDLNNNSPETIKFYEKYTEYFQDNPFVYNLLGHLYEANYKSEFIDKQIDYFRKAVAIKPNEAQFRRNLGLVAGRNGMTKLFKENYEQLLNLAPTENDYFDFACWGFNNRCFDVAHKYFWHRFYKETGPTPYSNLTYKLWDEKEDLTNKILYLRYEQGFGDTIMLSRFLPEFMKKAPNLMVQVQDPLCSFLHYNYPNIKFVSDEADNIDDSCYDYQFPMMELLSYLKVTDKTIPFKDKYLDVDKKKAADFRKKHIKNNKKLKIGVAYHGHPDYLGDNREMPIDMFADLAQIPNVEIYNLQVSNKNDFMSNEKCKNVIDLAPYFTDFEQTALAMKNMDLIISTDNVLLNLAGAMGLKTFGLFNYYTDYRWFAIRENDSGWYTSIKIYRAKKNNGWEEVMSNVIEDVSKLADQNK